MRAFSVVAVGYSLLCFSVNSVHAQLAVYCVDCTTEWQEVLRHAETVKQMLDQVTILRQQLQQQIDTLNAVAHLPQNTLAEVGSGFNVPALRSPLPGAGDMAGLVGGYGSGGALGGQLQQQLGTNRIYTAPGQDFGSLSLNTNAASIAGVQASVGQLYQSAQQHSQALQALEGELKAAPDAKATADIQARIAMEQAHLQSHQIQMQGLGTWQNAQTRLVSQQTEESRRCYIDAALNGTDTTQDTCARASSQGAVQLASAGTGLGSVASGYDQYLGQSVGSGQCVALLQTIDPSIGNTRTWTQGAQVQGNTALVPGTMIATFDGSGRYSNSLDGSSHAAVYLGQDANGIRVLDQWAGHAASERVIGSSGSTQANSAGAFFVIDHTNGT